MFYGFFSYPSIIRQGKSNEAQVNGAIGDMCRRLEMVGAFLDSVVKVDVMKDPWNIPIMEKGSNNALMANIQQGKLFSPNLQTKAV